MSEGLGHTEAARRLAVHGPNEIRREEPTPPWRILLRQFQSPLVLLLAGACALAVILGEVADAVAIGVIVVLNGVVGFLQEFRAERAVLALRAMTAPRARVRREGTALVVTASEVVPGDLLLLEEGDLVAADARLLAAHGLTSNEAMLTGESLPIEKSATPLGDDAPVGRADRVYAGTPIASGSGEAEVLATGMHTELGKIAHLLATAREESTPLQQNLEGVSRTLLVLCLAVVAVVGGMGVWHGQPWFEVVLTSVSLAVAAVPEGLPAIVTIALALGVQRLTLHNVLVRKLPSVETLGSASVICTDKTGTLTTGKMVVRRFWSPLDGFGDLEEAPASLLAAAASCNDADLDGASGDPTELALLAAARSIGVEKQKIESENRRIFVLPFDSTRKRMSVLRADGVLYVKGAVDLLLPLCTDGTEDAERANAELARNGLRVLAIAIGHPTSRDPLTAESNLQLLGLIGLADPPRPEAVAAVAQAQAAGITVVMITGDHPVTATAIAREMGILEKEQEGDGRVHARVTPQDKLQIVRTWKDRGAVVAMTGDGVNDAPALREAHIGVAMGKGGTEVTREAADMILTDDNFASIVAAIREGRAIFDNIRKTLVYLLTGNSGELLLMLGCSIAGLPTPLIPLQLLWINLVTDGMPALALVVDPADADVLRRPPRPLTQPMLGRKEWTQILLGGSLEASLCAFAFVWGMKNGGMETARSLCFSTLVFSELFRAFAARSHTRVFWEVGAFTNLRLLAVVIFSACLQIVLAYFPWSAALFRLEAPTVSHTLFCLGLALIPVSILEIWKLLPRLWRKAT